MTSRNRHGLVLKGAIVEKYVHPTTKREAVIRLDKSRMTFYATATTALGVEETFDSKNGAEVRNWLAQQLARTTTEFVLDWVPVIEVEVGGDDGYYYRDKGEKDETKIEVELTRYWLALTPDRSEWRKLDWAFCDEDSTTCLPAEERYAQSKHYKPGPGPVQVTEERKRHGGSRSVVLDRREAPFRIPYFQDKGNGKKSFLAYTPETWAGVAQVIETVRRARKDLVALVGTKAGIAMLEEVGKGAVPLMLKGGSK